MFVYRLTMLVILTAAIAGCGGEAKQSEFKPDAAAQAFVDGMNDLAAAIGRNDPTAISNAVEALINSPIDPKVSPTQAKQAVDTYRAKVKGKLKGDVAAQVSGLMDALEKAAG